MRHTRARTRARFTIHVTSTPDPIAHYAHDAEKAVQHSPERDREREIRVFAFGTSLVPGGVGERGVGCKKDPRDMHAHVTHI